MALSETLLAHSFIVFGLAVESGKVSLKRSCRAHCTGFLNSVGAVVEDRLGHRGWFTV